MTAPSPAGQTPADRGEANGPDSVESLIRWMLNTVDPLQSGVEVRAQCVALARRLAGRGQADLIERVARAIADARDAHTGSGFPCQCGWLAGFGVGWEERLERHRLACMAVAAVEVLRGEGR